MLIVVAGFVAMTAMMRAARSAGTRERMRSRIAAREYASADELIQRGRETRSQSS